MMKPWTFTVLAAAMLAVPAFATRPSGRFMDLLGEAMRQAEAAARSRGAQQSGPAAERRELISVWNPQACGFTDASVLRLSRPARIDRIDLWFNWRGGEESLPYRITGPDGTAVASGTMARDSCDPYQAAWCVGTVSPGLTLPAGTWTVRVASARVCRNAASGNEGFIRAWGAYAASAPAASATSRPAGVLGTRWTIREELPDGRYWTGTWTRRSGTTRIDATWTDSLSGQSFSEVLDLREQAGDRVTIYRRVTNGTYTGTIAPDRRTIRGTASWYPPGAFWTARIGD